MKFVYSPAHFAHSSTLHIINCPIPYFELPERSVKIRETLLAAGSHQESNAKENGLAPILAVHDEGFVRYLQSAYESGRPFYPEKEPVIGNTFSGKGRREPSGFLGSVGLYSFDSTAPIFEKTWLAAYWSAQTALTACEMVRSGRRSVYALCRPPGHHAGPNYHGGFCYLNNTAIAAKALQGDENRRVAILDIDFHHGNGTQDIFYSTPEVLFCSIHADPEVDYPYFWGGKEERGFGAGVGTNCNWPLPHKATADQFLAALQEALTTISSFQPDYLVLSLGFDCMKDDPIPWQEGAFDLGLEELIYIAKQISQLNLPTVIIQEGGYNLNTIGGYCNSFLTEYERVQEL